VKSTRLTVGIYEFAILICMVIMAMMSIYAWPQFENPGSNKGFFTSTVEGQKGVRCLIQDPTYVPDGKPIYCDEPDEEVFNRLKFGIAISIPLFLMILAWLRIGSKKR